MGSQKNFDPLFVLPHILFIKKSCEMLNLMRTVTDEWKLQELQVKNTYPWGPTINKVTSIFLNFWPLPFKYQHFFASKVCKYYRLSIYVCILFSQLFKFYWFFKEYVLLALPRHNTHLSGKGHKTYIINKIINLRHFYVK